MNDKDRQNYLVKWVKNNHEAETQQKIIIKNTCKKYQQQGGPSIQ